MKQGHKGCALQMVFRSKFDLITSGNLLSFFSALYRATGLQLYYVIAERKVGESQI